MEQLTLINVLLLFGGLVCNISYAMHMTKKRDKTFSVGFYLRDNGLILICTVVSAFIFFILGRPVATFLGIVVPEGSDFYGFHAVICGVLPLYFLEKIKKMAK